MWTQYYIRFTFICVLHNLLQAASNSIYFLRFRMNMLKEQGVRCVILTSGTLAPLAPLITELELDIKVHLENPHIVKQDQICVKILPNGPDGEQLTSTFKNRYSLKFVYLFILKMTKNISLSETMKITSNLWEVPYWIYPELYQTVY